MSARPDLVRNEVLPFAGSLLALLLAGFFLLEPLGVPVSATAALGAVVLIVIASRGTLRSPKKSAEASRRVTLSR